MAGFPGVTSRRIYDCTRQWYSRARREGRIALRDRDVDVRNTVGFTEIKIVIDELAPRIHHSREALGIR